MVENAQGNYIDNAIVALDAALKLHVEGDPSAPLLPGLLTYIRRELVRMKEDHAFVPTYGRPLVDQADRTKDGDLADQLQAVAYWRGRAVIKGR